MNTGELANYAEIIGGIAVLASLIYVAIQIRHNTAVVRTSNYADLSFKLSEFNSLVAQDNDLAEIYNRGIESYDGLSDVEKTRFNMAVSRMMQAVQAMFHLRRRGYIDARLAQTNFDSVALLLAAPGMQEWWQANAHWWEDDFRQQVDQMARDGQAALPDNPAQAR